MVIGGECISIKMMEDDDGYAEVKFLANRGAGPIFRLPFYTTEANKFNIGDYYVFDTEGTS